LGQRATRAQVCLCSSLSNQTRHDHYPGSTLFPPRRQPAAAATVCNNNTRSSGPIRHSPFALRHFPLARLAISHFKLELRITAARLQPTRAHLHTCSLEHLLTSNCNPPLGSTWPNDQQGAACWPGAHFGACSQLVFSVASLLDWSFFLALDKTAAFLSRFFSLSSVVALSRTRTRARNEMIAMSGALPMPRAPSCASLSLCGLRGGIVRRNCCIEL